MEIDDELINRVNEETEELFDKLDDVIFQHIHKNEDLDGHVFPFIIMSAISNILTKTALLAGEDRQFIFELLNDFIPPDDEINELIPNEDNNVIPFNKKRR